MGAKDMRCNEIGLLLDLEGYAQVGMVVKAWLENCNKHKSYIAIELTDGRIICSSCIDDSIIRMSMRVIEHYTKNLKLDIK